MISFNTRDDFSAGCFGPMVNKVVCAATLMCCLQNRKSWAECFGSCGCCIHGAKYVNGLMPAFNHWLTTCEY